MMIDPFSGPSYVAEVAITTRQWQVAKMSPTCFGDRKNRPGKQSRTMQIMNFIKNLNQASALSGVKK